MPSVPPRSDPPRPPPGDRLDALREALDLLGQRLRAGIAVAVGHPGAGAARDAVLALLADRHASRGEEAPGRPAAFWDERDEEDPPDPWGDARQEAAPGFGLGRPAVRPWGHPSSAPRPSAPPARSRARPWLAALAAGWRAARRWLARGPGRRPVLAALLVGGAAVLGVLACGPLAAAGLGVAGTALGLVALADAARNAAGPTGAPSP